MPIKKKVLPKQYITKKTLLAEVVEKYPDAAEVMTADYGFHCMSCFAAEMETIEEGAMVHGMEGKELTAMLANINKLIAKGKK